MAETKNNFLAGKMNKDLDSRLLPNNEYRDALNISVGKSENQSVGSLQNVLGNIKLTKPTSTGAEPFETNEDLVCIGYFVDNENNRIFQFLTDYQDPNPSSINLPPVGSEMKITVYDSLNAGNPYITLVSGEFLNLSITNLITGVNLVEGLLFWTDNRNQPRKINVNSAISNPADSPNPYYTNVDQISVAKYYPFIAPGIFSIIENNVIDGTPTLEGGQTKIPIVTISIGFTGLAVGDQLVGNGITVSDSAIVTNIVGTSGGISWVYVSGDYTTLLSDGDALTFYRCLMAKSTAESNLNGNDNFLSDKFVRFSYRFKFDDNEYSLIAPFTQPVFIPEQKGYFINGDEDAAYRSTVLEWMQNDVNSVKLLIELPDSGDNIINSYKIKSIDVLYKESDSSAIKVVETMSSTDVALQTGASNIYSYTYNSQKPKKTLQEAETLRVYDKVPIRALSQEVSGGRVIYGNFINQSTPPESLDYNVTVIEKNQPFESWLEYPNHTLKQNRTYQVGIVLADKFGRQSSVILSSASPYTTGGDILYGSSSVFFPYKNEFWTTDVRDWVGDQLAIIFNKRITSFRDEALGTPGLYATVSGSIPGSTDGFQIDSGTVSGKTYTFTLSGSPAQSNYPTEGNYLRGKYTGYVKVIAEEYNPSLGSYTVTVDADISDVYNHDGTSDPNIMYSYSINELGWYSYKVVVKQQEQEYYNVYIPGMLAGYPVWQTFKTDPLASTEPTDFPNGEDDSTCHFVLINDNINKVPRDLSEVGPNQRQYRSSVQLWGRVENVLIEPLGSSPTTYTTNRQYYPGTQSDVVNTIAPTTELGFLPNSASENPAGSAAFNLYQFETSPLIARTSTSNRVGVVGNYTTTSTPPSATNAMSPFLGVYETEPVVSALDIFWETSTSGYISELNIDIISGSDAIIGYSSLDFLYNENQNYLGGGNTTGAANSPYITEYFYFKNASGVFVPVAPGFPSTDQVIFSAYNRLGEDVTNKFELWQDTNPGLPGDPNPTYLYWRIKIKQNGTYFGTNVDLGSFVFKFAITHTVGVGPSAVTYTPLITTEAEVLRVSNIVPVITYPTTDLSPVYNLTSNPLIGPVADLTGKNGNSDFYSGNYLADLYWKYDPLPNIDYSQWFSVNSSTGEIILTNTNILPGTFDIRVKLQDASTSTGLQTTGGLNAYRTVRLVIPQFSTCGEWTSTTTANPNIGTGQTYTNATAGTINIWKMLRKNETVVNSTVKLIAYRPYNVPGGAWVFINGSYVTFGAPGVIGTASFTYNLFTNNSLSTSQAADKLWFSGTVYTSSGRNFVCSFETDALYVSGDLGEQVANAFGCSTGSPAYISDQCREWYIYNSSSAPIPWSGLHGNGYEIIGGVIQPGQTIGSPANGGTQPVVRYLSLQAAGAGSGSGAIGGQINYTGLAVTCPT